MAITNSKIHKDTSISHIHEDPKLISQQNAKIDLKLGQVVYQDDDGKYHPALADNSKKSLIQGIVWEFIGNDQFYLRSSPGPMTYRHPLTADFFDVIEQNKYVPNLPGEYGDILWLSQTVPGYVQIETNGAVIVGYKTDYGFLYQPKYIICCDGGDNSSSSSSRRRPPPPSSSSTGDSSSSSTEDPGSSSSSTEDPGSSSSTEDPGSSSSTEDPGSSSSTEDPGSSSSSDRRKVCWYVYFATYYCGVWYHHTPGSGRSPENYLACDYEDDYSEYNWIHEGCLAEKLVKGYECVVDNNGDDNCPDSPLYLPPNNPLENPPNCCPSSSSSPLPPSSSSSDEKKCFDVYVSYCDNSVWSTPTYYTSKCSSNLPHPVYPYIPNFDQWYQHPYNACNAYYLKPTNVTCVGDGECTQNTTVPQKPTFTLPACCLNSSSSSSSSSSYNYVCIWQYTAEWVCLANGNTGGWYVWKTLLSCGLSSETELPPQGWSDSGCTRTAMVPKFTNTPCNPPDNDCCYPAPEYPSLSTLPDRDTMNNLCCNYVYWMYTCTAAPHCSNGVLDWTVTGSLSNNFFYAKVPDTNWRNIVDECSDGRTYWVGPYLRSLTRDQVIALDPPVCGSPSVVPGSGCMPCSSSSSSLVCPPISPPIGFVNVTTSGFESLDARMNGIFTIPLNNNSGTYTIYQDVFPEVGTDTASVSVNLLCTESDIAPCPSGWPNTICGCFGATLPAGWYYRIEVSLSSYRQGGGSNAHFAYFAQSKNGGASQQSYTGFVNFNTDDRSCNPAWTATVS